MPLIVEDGTGKPDADSYVSLAIAKKYHADRGSTVWGGAHDAEQEAALRRATTLIDARYHTIWPGVRTNGRNQALDWPRTNAMDSSGYLFAGNEIPREIMLATLEAAVQEISAAAAFAGNIEQRIKSESVGQISVTYVDDGGKSARELAQSVIDDLLASLIGKALSSTTVTFLARA